LNSVLTDVKLRYLSVFSLSSAGQTVLREIVGCSISTQSDAGATRTRYWLSGDGGYGDSPALRLLVLLESFTLRSHHT